MSASPKLTQAFEKFIPQLPMVDIKNQKIIVIGSGPVGIRVCNDILKKNPTANICVFGNEPYSPYNRVQLSSVLAGDVARESVDIDLPDKTIYKNFSFAVCTIKTIDTEEKTITDTFGNSHDYDQLIIATGSRPFVPTIPGIDMPGVYTFRNLKDTDALYARVSRSKHIVVVGGGLLGIEAARALKRFNTRITLIQQGSRLMNRQLDDDAAEILTDQIKSLDIHVITESGVRVVHGITRVDGVTTNNGEKIDCDTVLFCTGISPNVKLARQAGLKVNHGIVVNDQLGTSANNVYAIGECCEHSGQTYGLVSPGFEQSAVLADNLSGGSSLYQGSQKLSRLKVLGRQVVSMGDVADFGRHGLQREIVFRNGESYRKIIVHKGRLIGALAIGDWPALSRIQQLFQQQDKIYPWQRWLFSLQGELWWNKANNDVNLWPKAAVVCQCNNITQGELVTAIDGGCASFKQLSTQCNAGTVCGSCKPLVQQLLGYKGPADKEKGWPLILIASLAALLISALIYFIPGFTIPDSVQESAPLQDYWNDKFWKQVSGFSLLGMATLGLFMSIRKRLNSKRLGDFAFWRVFHVVLGTFCVSLLIMHTGLHLGTNLNQYLMINFLAVIALGSIAGISVAFGHKLSPAKSQSIKKTLAWTHLLVSWPLPMLVGAHIITVYYF